MRKSSHPSLFNFFAGAVALVLLILTVRVFGAEPLMDTDLFKVSRLEAYNLTKDGFFPKAFQAEERAYQIAQAQFGPIHPSLAPILSDLGTLYHILADYKNSEREYKWGLALVEKNLGPDDPAAADFLDRLASLYLDLDRLEEAVLLEKRSLDIRKTDASAHPRAICQTLGLLGRIENQLLQFSQAQNHLTQALDLTAKTASSDPKVTIDLLNVLSQSYLAEKKPSEAQDCLERALNLAQKNLNGDNPEIADAMERLGDFFRDQSRMDKAKPLYETAARMDKPLVGTNYSYDSLPYLKRLAKADFSIGEIKTSESLWKKSIEVEKTVYGPRHPYVAVDLVHLAQVETALGHDAVARKNLKESIGILKNNFAGGHPLILWVQTRLK